MIMCTARSALTAFFSWTNSRLPADCFWHDAKHLTCMQSIRFSLNGSVAWCVRIYSKLMQLYYLRCCSPRVHSWMNSRVFLLKFTLDFPAFLHH